MAATLFLSNRKLLCNFYILFEVKRLKKVSVVVPVYNAEQYIDQCMKCLLGQTLQDMEIIAVNDKSTDESGNILEKWMKKYPDIIKVIHSNVNRGPGGARNLGIALASGEYIGFMDCDDLIDRTMYEKLLSKAESDDCDIVDCGYYEELSDTKVLSYTDDVIGELNPDKKNMIIAEVGYAVTKIFKSQILQREDMRIREGVIYEDLDFLIHATLLAKRVGNVKEILYIYKNNQQSVSKKHNEQKKFEDMISAFEAIQELDTEGVRMGMQYAKLTCIACAIGICLLNQDNSEFKLMENLKEVRRISAKTMENRQDNEFVISKMTNENKNILDWFTSLKI